MIVRLVWLVGLICLPLFISGCDSSKDVSVGVCVFHGQCSDKGAARGLLVLYCVFPQKGIVLGVERLPCIRV